MNRHDVNNFAQKVQCLVSARDLIGGGTIHVDFRRKFARIFNRWGGQDLCWGWVDMSTGDIHRGGWKKPDTRYGARGNIRDADIMGKIDWTGPRYL